jgi:hypothetical protein
MWKTVFTMWRLVFGSKGKINKRGRRSKRKRRKNNHEKEEEGRNMFVRADKKKEGSDKVGIFFKQQNFIQLVKLKIDSVKLVHWYDETNYINTNAPISKEVLSKIKV